MPIDRSVFYMGEILVAELITQGYNELVLTHSCGIKPKKGH